MCECGPQTRPNYDPPANALHFGGSLKGALKQLFLWARLARELWLLLWSLKHQVIRPLWSMVVFYRLWFFFFCCQTWRKWCVIWSKMPLFVLICCFNILWLPAITLLWQGSRDPWRWCESGMCQALWGFGAKCGQRASARRGLRAGTDPGDPQERTPTKLRRDGWKCCKLNSHSIKENGNGLILSTAGKSRPKHAVSNYDSNLAAE